MLNQYYKYLFCKINSIFDNSTIISRDCMNPDTKKIYKGEYQTKWTPGDCFRESVLIITE